MTFYLPPEIVDYIFEIKDEIEKYDNELEKYNLCITTILTEFKQLLGFKDDKFINNYTLLISIFPKYKEGQYCTIYGEDWYSNINRSGSSKVNIKIHYDDIKKTLTDLFIDVFRLNSNQLIYNTLIYKYIVTDWWTSPCTFELNDIPESAKMWAPKLWRLFIKGKYLY